MLKGKKIVILPILILSAVAIALFFRGISTKKSNNDLVIGILQTVSHPALDQTRDGFVDYLKMKLGNRVSFIFQNAEGAISSMHGIAKSFHSNRNVDGIFAIATPAVQAASNVERKKPVFIAAITDPKALGLIYPGTNVCGAVDMIDVKGEINMLKALLPNVKKVALLFNPAEANSITLIKMMKKELDRVGLTYVDVGVSNEAEIVLATVNACKKGDAILVPTDNVVVAAMSTVSSIALKNKTPLIVSDNPSVGEGALASRGVDFKEFGELAAQCAIDVFINGKKPSDLPLAKPQKNTIIINKKALNELGISIPEEIEEEGFILV